jgi:ribosome biogenesis GTPase
LATQTSLETGLVVAGHGRHVWIETATGERVLCHPRGKKSQAVVGDRVLWLPSKDEGTIERVVERTNLFYRQDEIRTKSFAANLDQIVLLIAAEPEYSESQLSRALIAAEAQQIRPIIALNKSDLTIPFNQAWERLGVYRAMGYQVIPLAIKPRQSGTCQSSTDLQHENLAVLESQLRGKVSLVLGPSGSGKSTLINRLVPNAKVLTNEISMALNTGKHTTTSTSMYWVDRVQKTALIDSPGFQEFGLNHIEPMQLAGLMPDIQAHAGNCKFYNCTHLHEPGCGVIAATQSTSSPALINDRRYKLYSDFFAELSEKRY